MGASASAAERMSELSIGGEVLVDGELLKSRRTLGQEPDDGRNLADFGSVIRYVTRRV